MSFVGIGDGGHASVLQEIFSEYDQFIIAIGDNATRKRISEQHRGFGKLVHSSAVVSGSAIIGEGTVIMAGAIVQANARIGKHCIINTGATVDHDCVIGDYVHIAPGAHLCGHVEVGEGSLIGVGVGIAPMCKIPPWTLVKARRLEMVPLYD